MSKVAPVDLVLKQAWLGNCKNALELRSTAATNRTRTAVKRCTSAEQSTHANLQHDVRRELEAWLLCLPSHNSLLARSSNRWFDSLSNHASSARNRPGHSYRQFCFNHLHRQVFDQQIDHGDHTRVLMLACHSCRRGCTNAWSFHQQCSDRSFEVASAW